MYIRFARYDEDIDNDEVIFSEQFGPFKYIGVTSDYIEIETLDGEIKPLAYFTEDDHSMFWHFTESKYDSVWWSAFKISRVKFE